MRSDPHLEQVRRHAPVDGPHPSAVQLEEATGIWGCDVRRAGWIWSLHEAGEVQVSVHVLLGYGRLAGGGCLSVYICEERRRLKSVCTFVGRHFCR